MWNPKVQETGQQKSAAAAAAASPTSEFLVEGPPLVGCPRNIFAFTLHIIHPKSEGGLCCDYKGRLCVEYARFSFDLCGSATGYVHFGSVCTSS
jgi:hypothetical protein